MQPTIDTQVRITPTKTLPPKHDRLAEVFNDCFGESYRVRCIGGYAEPEYLPVQQAQGYAQLRYTQDYAASALHEIAHWCVAGRQRLNLADFGYGYLPPPRDAQTQERFFALEFKVQLLEAWFAAGTGVRFVASADNFDCAEVTRLAFAQRIAEALAARSNLSIPPRALVFTAALAAAGLGVWPLSVQTSGLSLRTNNHSTLARDNA